MVKALADRLKRTRKEHPLTQGELADLSGVNRVHISRLETGKRGTGKRGILPRPSTIRALAAALGVRPQWLLTGELPKRPPMSPNGTEPAGAPPTATPEGDDA